MQNNPLRSLSDAMNEIRQRFDDILNSAAEDAAARTEDDPAAEHARESAEPVVEGLCVRTVHGDDQQGASDRDADTIGD